MLATAKDILQQYWGLPNFRPAQEEIIELVLQQQDVLGLLPTGGGKSICFQVPALAQSGICIVVSPLIALMQDQVNALKERGIKALMLGGKLHQQEVDQLLDNCIYGNYKFLYLSPERLQNDLVQARIQQMPVSLIAIDEAHCISEWGHDFRPAYLELPILRELCPGVPMLALTATATQKVGDDIVEKLALKNPRVVRYSFNRKNIHLRHQKTEDKDAALLRFLAKNPGSGILYVRNRKATISLREHLVKDGFSAEAYHGGMSSTEKQKALTDWLREEKQLMVATTAFGMGIDKANVRNIIHFQIPESLESYFQEIGRAGRDELPANALLLYHEADLEQLQHQFLAILPTPKRVKMVYNKLTRFFSIAYGEGQHEVHNFSFLRFCNTYQLPLQPTYQVLQLLDRSGVIQLTQQFHKQTEIQFLVSDKVLFRFLAENPRFEPIVKTLLRMYGGFFDFKIAVNLPQLSSKTGIAENKLLPFLQQLAQREIIDLEERNQDTSLSFLVPREDDVTINPLIPYIEQQYQVKSEKIKAVLQFLANDKTCKMVQLLRYFGETDIDDCQVCSVCLAKQQSGTYSRTILNQVAKSILKILKTTDLDSKSIVDELDYPKEMILFVLRKLLDHGNITKTGHQTYKLRS